MEDISTPLYVVITLVVGVNANSGHSSAYDRGWLQKLGGRYWDQFHNGGEVVMETMTVSDRSRIVNMVR